MPLDNLVARRAHGEGTAGFDGGEERVTVLKARLEVLEGLVELVEEPF